MATPIYHAPQFDKLELDLAPEILFTPHQKLTPVRAGETVNGLTTERNRGNWHPYFDEITLHNKADFLQYTHKSLLLYFYEKDWGHVSAEHLRQLSAARNELNNYNINVLVVTSASLENFRLLSWKEGLKLDVYEDRAKELATLLKIYSEHGPSWGRYAGIERNVALPALYLLGNARQIALDFSNEAIHPKLPLEQVIAAVYFNLKYSSEKKSA